MAIRREFLFWMTFQREVFKFVRLSFWTFLFWDSLGLVGWYAKGLVLGLHLVGLTVDSLG